MTQALQVYRRSELEAISHGCLHRYRAIWIDGVDDSSDISLLGQTFAKVKHCYIVRLVDCGLPSDAEEATAAFIEGVAMAQLPARLIPELRELWTFHTGKFELDLKRFVAAEERGGDEVTFAPDLVMVHQGDNALEIIDDKSGWHPPLTEAELKELFQARVYSRYARDRWPNFDSYWFTIHAVRFAKSTTVSFTQAELDTVDIEMQAAIATIELAKQSNVWPAIPGPACRFCTLACPVADQKLLLPKRLPVDMRDQVAQWLLVAEKQVSGFKKVLRESVKEHGPIDVNGVVWDLRPSISRTYPLDVVLEALKVCKIDRQAAEVQAMGGDMTLSHSALKKLIKQFPELEQALKGKAKEKSTFRFSAKAAGDDDTEEE